MTLKKGCNYAFVTIKGYKVVSYFNCSVTPRNAEFRYVSGNEWVIRKPNVNWVGTIKASITVQADANYGKTRKRVINDITIKCI